MRRGRIVSRLYRLFDWLIWCFLAGKEKKRDTTPYRPLLPKDKFVRPRVINLQFERRYPPKWTKYRRVLRW